jgi:hypothetical protein
VQTRNLEGRFGENEECGGLFAGALYCGRKDTLGPLVELIEESDDFGIGEYDIAVGVN